MSISSAGSYAYEDDEAGAAPFVRTRAPAQAFTSLTAADLRPRMEAVIAGVVEQTGLSPGDATLLLHVSSWSSERLLERWWETRERLRREAGLTAGADPPAPPAEWAHATTVPCPVSLDDVPPAAMDALPCSHWFSRAAWRDAITASMSDAAAAQTLRCLASPSCNELVRERIVQASLSPESFERWQEFTVRRYARDCRGIVWCPAPECPFALAHTDDTRISQEVTCRGGHTFCFGCARLGGHRPASCEEATAWEARDTADGASLTWISLNTKNCPKCRGAIERSSGCNKVICCICSTAMCWACGLEYYKAAGHTYPQGAWTCNRPPGKFEGDAAGRDLVRFAHYRSRVASSRESAVFARKELPAVEARLEELAAAFAALPTGDGSGGSVGDLDFITAALQTVIAGRTFLAFSYMHAFALHPVNAAPELALFADQQSVLEGTVERLQQRVEASAIGKLIDELTLAIEDYPSSSTDMVARDRRKDAPAPCDVALDAAPAVLPAALPHVTRRHEHARLVPTWAHLPDLTRGYRVRHDTRDALWSLITVHLDTINIWTHLLGFIYFVWLVPYTFSTLARNDAPVVDIVFFAIYLFAVCVQMATSTLYHVLRCVSSRFEALFLQLDVLGITGLVLASYIIGLGQGFECNRVAFTLYIAMQIGLTLASNLLLRASATRPHLLSYYYVLLCASVAWGIVPCAHVYASCPWGADSCLAVFRLPLLGMFGCYALGAAFFFSRLPERLAPGTFDIVGHSHQLWHVYVVLAGRAWLLGMLDLNTLKAQGGHGAICGAGAGSVGLL